MNHKQIRFVQEYLKDFHATKAAERAGYSERGAHSQGHTLLKNPEIKNCLKDAIDACAVAAGVTREKVLRELATIAFSDIGEILDFTGETPRLRPVNQIPRHARRSIASVKVKCYTEGRGDEAREVEVTEFKFWDKTKALENLSKHLGMITEKLELTGRDGGPLEVREYLVRTREEAQRLISAEPEASPVPGRNGTH